MFERLSLIAGQTEETVTSASKKRGRRPRESEEPERIVEFPEAGVPESQFGERSITLCLNLSAEVPIVSEGSEIPPGAKIEELRRHLGWRTKAVKDALDQEFINAEAG